jgi:hypothetical protein
MDNRKLAGLEQFVGIKEKLKIGSPTYNYVLKRVVDMLQWKNNFVESNKDRWDKNRKLYFQIMTKQEEAEDKAKEQMGQLGDLVIPMAYKVAKAIIDVALEELERRRYYYELLPFHELDYPKVLFLNILQQDELKKQKYLMILRQVLEDSIIYGCGIMHISWSKEYVTQYNEVPLMGDKLLNIPTQKIVEKQTKLVYEGNVINNINPALFDFDTAYSILDIDKWRYCIIRSLLSIDDLIEIVRNGEGFINIEELQRYAQSQGLQDFLTPVIQSTNILLSREEMDDLTLWWGQGRKVLVENIYAKIVPSKVGLGSSDDEEIWLFTIVNRRIIIKATPMTYNHNKFPIVIYTWNASLNEKFPAALLDYVEPLQSYINWLLRKYAQNVNASINRMFIINPDLLDDPNEFQFDRAMAIMKVNPRKAKLYGNNIIDNAIKELNFDVKLGSHLQVLPLFLDLVRVIAGVSELYMAQFPRGRRTKGEVQLQATLSSQSIRALLRNMHNIIGHRISTIITSNLRQFLQGDRLIELRADEYQAVLKASDLARNQELIETITGRKLLRLDTEFIKGDYDYYLGDYLEPSYDEKTLNALVNIFGVLGNMPAVSEKIIASLKVDKFVELLFRLSGIKNAEDYINPQFISTTVGEDMIARQQAQAQEQVGEQEGERETRRRKRG